MAARQLLLRRTQRGLEPFRVALPYGYLRFTSGQEIGTLMALLSWNICISVTETQATRVVVTAEKTGFALKRN